MQHISAE